MSKKIQKNIPILMAVIIGVKLFGMLRSVALANFYGTTNISDAYLVAYSVPTLLFYFIGQALSTAFIPMYNKVRKESGKIEADMFSNNIANISLIICILIVAVLFIFPKFVVTLFAAGFDADTTDLATSLIRISSFSLFIMVLANLGSGYLHANDSFLAPAAISLPRNIAIILSVVISYYFGTHFLGWGILVGHMLGVLFLLPFILKKGYRYKPYINLKDENIRETLYITMPIIIGVGINQISNIINKSIASTISEGAMSALNYASVLNNAVQEILVTGVITILFADSAAHVARNEFDEVKHKLSKTINGMITLLLPAAMGVLILARPIITVFFSRGSFNEQSVDMTAAALRFYAVGLTFLAVRDTLIKVFYAYKDTRTTTVTAIFAIILNIILSLVLSKSYGVMGLAMAISFSSVSHCIVLYILLRKKIGDFALKDTMSLTAKALIASIFMAVAVIFVYTVFSKFGAPMVISLFSSIAFGMAIYGLAAILLKIPPVIMVIEKLKEKIRKI